MIPQYIVFNDDGCAWPNPDDPNDIEWKLRHGTPTNAELLHAAAFLSAYKTLFTMTQKEAIARIKRIKEET